MQVIFQRMDRRGGKIWRYSLNKQLDGQTLQGGCLHWSIPMTAHHHPRPQQQ